MPYTDDRYHLRVHFEAKECTIPADERARMQTLLAPLGAAVQDFPTADLGVKVIYHPRSRIYHVEARLHLPGQSLFAGDRDAYLDSAFQRCVRKLTLQAKAYREHPDREADRRAEAVMERPEAVMERRLTLNRDIVASEEPDGGMLGRAVQAGDYQAFRTLCAGYEEWLRNRIGRWVQRYPDAQDQIGNGLALGDLLEEVYLNAFEHFEQRPKQVPFHEWLEGLIDPSLKWFLKHADAERENVSVVRSLRETPLP
jgi:hypothetical protein